MSILFAFVVPEIFVHLFLKRKISFSTKKNCYTQGLCRGKSCDRVHTNENSNLDCEQRKSCWPLLLAVHGILLSIVCVFVCVYVCESHNIYLFVGKTRHQHCQHTGRYKYAMCEKIFRRTLNAQIAPKRSIKVTLYFAQFYFDPPACMCMVEKIILFVVAACTMMPANYLLAHLLGWPGMFHGTFRIIFRACAQNSFYILIIFVFEIIRFSIKLEFGSNKCVVAN